MFEKMLLWGYLPDVLLHTVLLALPFLFLLIYLTKKDSRIYKHFQAFPGPTPFPIVGSAISVLGPRDKLWDVLFTLVETYGSSFVIWLGNLPYVFLGNANDIEKILSSAVHVNKGNDYEQLGKPWLGSGLLTARREKWNIRRRLLTPTFHLKILEDFVPIFNEQAQILTVVLERERQKQDSFDICPFISKCTLDIICETAMGEKINAQTGGEINYVKAVSGMTYVLTEKALNPLYRLPIIWSMLNLGKLETEYLNTLHGFTAEIIRDKKDRRNRKFVSTEAGSITNDKTENNSDGKRKI